MINSYPGDPGATIPTKGKIPSGLKALEELIRLEKCSEADRIHKT